MSLARVFFASFRRRKFSTALAFLAIVLGATLGVAVHVVHEAALVELERATRELTGEADWSVHGGGQAFDDALWSELAQFPGVSAAAPVIALDLRLFLGADQAPLSVPLLAIDPLVHLEWAPQLALRPWHERLDVLAEDALFLSPAVLEKLMDLGGLQSDPQGTQTVTVLVGERRLALRVAGDLPGLAENHRLAVMDVAAAQKHFGLQGKLTRIDLKLTADADLSALRARLSPGLVMEKPHASTAPAARASRAYRVNLGLLSGLALLTGLFLVFSAQALSLARRQTEFAFLRALGMPPSVLYAGLLAEGGLLGLAGSLLGAVGGHAVAAWALSRLGGDLGAGYFAGLAPEWRFSWQATLLFVFLGTLAGLLGAWLPARTTLRMHVAQALKALPTEPLPLVAIRPQWGAAMLLVAAGSLFLPPWQGLPLGGYLAVAFLLAGALIYLPRVSQALACVLARNRFLPPSGFLAVSRIAHTPAQSLLAAAGVMTSLALASAMAIMVHAFRDSLDHWLAQVLPGELYLRAVAGRTPAGLLSPELQEKLASIPGIQRIDFTRHEQLALFPGQTAVTLLARSHLDVPVVGRTAATEGPTIWISEALADLSGWRPGNVVEVPLAGALYRFTIKGIWRDYARQHGAIIMELDLYRKLTGALGVHEATIQLTPDADETRVKEAIERLAHPGTLEMTRTVELRAKSLAFFDRTFLITYLIEGVAILIGLAGVAATFAAIAAARRREFGMLRHLGLTRRDIGLSIAIEAGVIALAGVSMGLVGGFAIAGILIEVINRQSFHWSMDWAIPWFALGVFAFAMIVLAIGAAIAAGRAAMQPAAVFAVREDW
ncbi:MAG: ABC transporter permease [Rhodocyclaceae bacterium]|nr:ABC transporter permease [Rhodocyclaceae bacterium]